MPRPRQFDEAEVICAARDEFWSRGYAGTSVDNLTAATGLGKGSLYGAFGDKHTLYLRALDDWIADSMAKVRRQLQDPRRGAYDRLVRHVRAEAKAIAADKTLRGCMIAKSAAELSATDPAVERAVERAYREWRTLLADCIEAAQRDGSIDSDRDPRTLATVLLGFLRGLEALHKGGVKSSQLIAAADEVISLISRA
ncbi:TetR family transcriptional regulator [Mycobacterium sp. IS-1590]|uniref:TetR/AcrR family transcriptional regulator n=1 Tax=Mycobacterium sp. IS-1590 TaxID=1772286 RepID=UPI0007482B19|nr:TetR/AcrR family transcriptional regulator [Mycobacterium sp. IS-1590]KUI44237.1 TetR family transcriptional regulator [Mycobacterium sp. IS-1590]